MSWSAEHLCTAIRKYNNLLLYTSLPSRQIFVISYYKKVSVCFSLSLSPVLQFMYTCVFIRAVGTSLFIEKKNSPCSHHVLSDLIEDAVEANTLVLAECSITASLFYSCNLKGIKKLISGILPSHSPHPSQNSMWALGAAEQPGATLPFLHSGQKEPLREREAVAIPYFDFQVFSYWNKPLWQPLQPEGCSSLHHRLTKHITTFENMILQKYLKTTSSRREEGRSGKDFKKLGAAAAPCGSH